MEKIKRVKRLPKAIRSEEFPLLLKNTRKNDISSRIAFLLSYTTGMRLSEVLHLKPENIKDNMIEVWAGKGNKDRTVPKPKGWKENMIKHIPIKKTGRTLERNFKTAARKAGLPSFYTFHSLRHGFATRLIENGVPLSHVQQLLGHSNISTTSIYTNARPQDALKSYEEFF